LPIHRRASDGFFAQLRGLFCCPGCFHLIPRIFGRQNQIAAGTPWTEPVIADRRDSVGSSSVCTMPVIVKERAEIMPPPTSEVLTTGATPIDVLGPTDEDESFGHRDSNDLISVASTDSLKCIPTRQTPTLPFDTEEKSVSSNEILPPVEATVHSDTFHGAENLAGPPNSSNRGKRKGRKPHRETHSRNPESSEIADTGINTERGRNEGSRRSNRKNKHHHT